MTERLGEGYVVCRLRIPLHPGQSYLQSVPSAYPGLLIEITGYLPVGPREVTINLRISGNVPLDDVLESIRGCPDVTSFEVMGRADHSALLRVRSRLSDPSVIKTVQEFQIVPDFPDYVKDGKVTTVVVCSGETIRGLLARLDERFPGTVVDSVRKEALNTVRTSLTPHELEMFKLAISSGYWDVPRRASVSDLAGRTRLAKSTLSEILSRIESKLLHEMGEQLYRPS